MWHKPVCANCRIDMFPEKNGVSFVEQHKVGTEIKPYKIWEVDMWSCSGCGASVLIGFGKDAHAFHHEETFNAVLEEVKKDHWTVIESEKGKGI